MFGSCLNIDGRRPAINKASSISISISIKIGRNGEGGERGPERRQVT
jgi:hypothetical protein